MNDELLSSAEFCRRAGCSYRQLDHWLRKGYLGVVDTPGSGRRRRVPARLVGRARTLAALTGGMNTGELMHRLVVAVCEHYDAGRFDIAAGVTLSWPVEAMEGAA